MGATRNLDGAIYAPDLPWNTYVPEDLGPVIMSFIEDHEPFFRWWAQVWFENFQFLFGNQNIRWSRKNGFALDYDNLRQKMQSTSMRAQTNISRVVVEALASMIYSNLPSWEVEAMDESSLKGKRWKKICQKLLDCLMVRLSMDQEFAVAAVHYVLFGQFAWKFDWRPSAGSLIEIPRWRKTEIPQFSTYMAPNPFTGGLIETTTPITDERGNQQKQEGWEPIVDEFGRQIVNKVFSGGAEVRTLSPLEYRRGIGTYGMHKTRYVQDFRLVDYDQFLEETKNIPGATKAYKRIRPVYSEPRIYNMAIRHFMRMQFTTPPTLDEAFRGGRSIFKSSLFKYKVLVVEHYDAPHSEKWPEGRRTIVCNGDVTHVTKPSYTVPGRMDGWHPYVEAQWLNVAPSSIAAGPVNDVIRKNRELDIKDSLIATSVRRNMGSQLLVKSGSGIDPQRLTGEPGVAHEVSDPYGARYLHDDLPIPPVIAALRQADKDDVYEVSGAGEALRGQPSSGASSGYQEKQREEREEKRLAPARKNFRSAAERGGEKLIYCLKANVVRLEDDMMGYMKRSAAGEYTPQDVIAFLSTPLDFGVDIKIKESSMAYKSRATIQASLMELAGGPAAQRIQGSAKVLDRFLKQFDGGETLRDSSAAHRDRAERENEAFLDFMRLGPNAEGVSWPKVMFEDDDDIHLEDHGEFAVQNAEALLQNDWLMLQFLIHVEHHRLQKQEKGGELMPGTALQTGNMMGAAKQAAAPTVTTIYQKSMMDQANQQQQQQQPQQGPAQPPRGPRQAQPKAPNPQAPQGQAQAPQAPRTTGGRTNPQAPSGATQPAMARGGLR